MLLSQDLQHDRGTEANMGKSDILETFSIFAQAKYYFFRKIKNFN